MCENKNDRTIDTKYYLRTVEIKDYNAIADEQNFFGQPVKNNLGTYKNIQKIPIGQGDGYTTCCLLDYNYFNKYYNIIAINLCKHQAPDIELKAIEQSNFTGNINRQIPEDPNIKVNTIIFFILDEWKEAILDFSGGTVEVL